MGNPNFKRGMDANGNGKDDQDENKKQKFTSEAYNSDSDETSEECLERLLGPVGNPSHEQMHPKASRGQARRESRAATMARHPGARNLFGDDGAAPQPNSTAHRGLGFAFDRVARINATASLLLRPASPHSILDIASAIESDNNLTNNNSNASATSTPILRQARTGARAGQAPRPQTPASPVVHLLQGTLPIRFNPPPSFAEASNPDLDETSTPRQLNRKRG